MADVRALLRQQRAARRITHPYATYSDTGKLLCTLCRDQIRAESHWDAHLASDKHKKRLSAISEATNASANANANGNYRGSDDEVNDQEQSEGLDDDVEDRDQRADTPSATHKRKLDLVAATAADEHDTDKDMDDDEDDVRRKRSRHASPDNGRRKPPQGPSQGVQVQMPSRSTTPADSQHSGSSAAKTTTKLATSLPSRQASSLATPASSSSMSIQQEAPPPQHQPQTQTQPEPQPPASTSQTQQQIDEDEWAAFEADIAAETAPYDADAVISRPAMTAEEAAAAAAAEQEAAGLQNPESRKAKADADIEDEREEATRALEEEFEEMQELEARVQRLKEKREALKRKRGETIGQDQADGDDVAPLQATTKKPSSDPQGEGKENAITAVDNEAEAENNDEEDDEDDDEEDDWDGFRFRTGR